jgi:hypothetical protein
MVPVDRVDPSVEAYQPIRRSWTGWATAPRAALIYQHRTSLRDEMIADEISRRAEAERSSSGTQRARDDMDAS